MNSLNQKEHNMFQFQAHITTEHVDNLEDYIALCETCKVKPVLIKLAKGNFVNQPMYTQNLVAERLDDVMLEVERVKKVFTENGFLIIRTKIEINAEQVIDYFQIDVTQWENRQYREHCIEQFQGSYFEVHMKVKYNDLDLLKEIAIKNNLYLSQNDREPGIRFLSVRKNLADALNLVGEDGFELRTYHLHEKNLSRAFEQDLKAAHMEIVKEKYECCIYDSNQKLDSNWGFHER